jgi:hypothetical protein
MEYHVAAHCIIEGFVEEGLSVLTALRQRYNGTRRNPYNEIECGDHYARAMAGWSVLDALSGFRYNALTDAFSFVPTDEVFKAPFIIGSGWGTFEQVKEAQGSRVRLACVYGDIRLAQLSLNNIGSNVVVSLDGKEIATTPSWQDDMASLTFEEPITLRVGSQLEVIAE